MESRSEKLKSIYEYSDYRLYIRDYYIFSKARNSKFSHRLFARLAGFKSSNFIKFLIDGKSNVSDASAGRLALAMKMNSEEIRYFKTLVSFNQATQSEEKHIHAQQLVKFSHARKVFPLREQLFNYTSKWYLSMLRGIVALVGFKEDLKWLSSSIKPELSQNEIKKGFEELVDLGLLARDNEGRLYQTQANIATDDEVAMSSIAMFHREMMQRASESIDRYPRTRRDISGITFGVTKETALKIKEMTQNFRKEVVSLASQDSKSEALYQLNIQLFPLFDIEDNTESLKGETNE